MKTNKILTYFTFISLMFCPIASLAEQDAALSKTNAPQIVITNLVTAIDAARELHKLWPSHDGEYMMTVRKILDVFSQNEETSDVQKAVRKIFDDAIALQTVYGDAIDYQHLGCKRSILRSLIVRSRAINTDPEKWLALAKFVGQMKGEIKPVDYGGTAVTTKHGVIYVNKPRASPNPSAEEIKKIYLGEYQVRLKNAIKELTGELVNNAYKAEFDDDSKRKEYKENLVKFAQLSEDDANRMDVSKRVNTSAPPAANPAQTTKPEK